MKMTVRRSEERGRAQFGWLDSRHTFSFGDYHDPRHMGFRNLRVINEDRVAPGGGFPPHPHRDMEIVSYVLEGGLAHKDSTGTNGVIRPGDVQRMSAGTGIVHSEMNASKTESVHFLQIWILPERGGLPAGYEQKAFTEDEKRGRLRVVADRRATDGAVTLHADAVLLAGVLDAGQRASHALARGRHAWVQVARGSVKLNGEVLRQGDGASVSAPEGGELVVEGVDKAEVLVFDLA